MSEFRPFVHELLTTRASSSTEGLRSAASGISTHPCQTDEPHVQALIKLEVACRLALDALPQLPNETEQVLRDPVERLCEVTGAELDAIDPDWRSR